MTAVLPPRSIEARPLDRAIDPLVDGWSGPPRRCARHPAHLTGEEDARVIALQQVLDQLCADLGVCLSEREQRRLRRLAARHPDELTEEILAAVGLDPVVAPNLWLQVRDLLDTTSLDPMST